MFGLKVERVNYGIMVAIATTNGEICLGVGWWVRGHWWQWDGWWHWRHLEYDGRWFCARLGPLFYTRGPYW